MNTPSNWLGWLTLVARVYAMAGIAILLAFLIGEGLSGDQAWSPDFAVEEGLLFVFFPIGVAAGLMLGLWRPLWGGAIATLALIAFYLVFLIVRGELPRGPYFVLFSGGGPLLLLAGWLKRSAPPR